METVKAKSVGYVNKNLFGAKNFASESVMSRSREGARPKTLKGVVSIDSGSKSNLKPTKNESVNKIVSEILSSAKLSEDATITIQNECNSFKNYEDRSILFVDDLIRSAGELIQQTGRDVLYEREECKVPNIEWPLVEEFNVQVGAERLDYYIKSTMVSEERWCYSITFLGKTKDEVSTFYKYQVNFAIPSNPYPVAQATASLLFTYEITNVLPAYCPVLVSFQLEAFNMVMVPGKDLITDSLLFRVIDSKLAIFKKVYF